MKPRVLLVRGHVANPWELGAWEGLTDRFEVSFLQTGQGQFDTRGVALGRRPARTVRDALPRGRLGDLLVRVPGDRYLRPLDAFAAADVVHAHELGNWSAAQAAAAKQELGFKLVLTAWETIPFRATFRNVRTRPYRRRVLEHTDLFLATTERAAACLRMEGAPQERIRVVQPGVDTARFGAAAPNAERHTVLSPGRLVWEKGHHDVLRAVAAIRRGVVNAPVRDPRVVIVGRGREERRLKAYAADLGIADLVELRGHVPYEEMPAVLASASCLVLASIPVWYWEEQFGMVLAEAMGAGLPALASRCGAIPEVCGGVATLFDPGDWLGLARALADGPLSRDPAFRATPDAQRVRFLSVEAAAARLATAYDDVLAP